MSAGASGSYPVRVKRIRGSVVVVASLALVGGCSTGSDQADVPATVTVTDTAEADPSTSSSSSSGSSPTPTAADGETTETATATPTSGGLPTDVGEYADAFVRAWGIGDRPDASRYATVSTVGELFGMDARGGSGWSRQDSTDQGGRMQVRYTDDEGMTLYVLVDRATAAAGDEDAVVGANLEWEDTGSWEDDTYDPGEEASGLSDITVSETTTGDYCDALVRAWGAGQRSTADRYATPTAMTGLFDDYGTGGSGWSRISAGTHSASYTHTDGTTLTLYVNHVAVEAGRGDAAYYAEFS